MYIADLHIHSRFSRATSRDCDVSHLDWWARRKGIGLVGTGDFTHPAWRAELREQLVPAGEGVYTLREALRLLLPALKKSLRKLGRGIRVEPLRISLTLAGKNDPADAAEKYGYLQAAMWTVMPQLQRWMRIPDPRIHTGVDFDAERTDFSGEAAVTFRLGTLFAMGFALLIPAVKWFLHYRKRRRDDDTKEMTPPQTAEEPPKTAA